MAYNESDEIAWGSGYNLGDYSFSIERDSVPGSTNDRITAVCTQGGKSARKTIQILSSSQIEGWYVEANETEATVYVDVKSNGIDLPSYMPSPAPSSTAVFLGEDGQINVAFSFGSGVMTGVTHGASQKPALVGASTAPAYISGYKQQGGEQGQMLWGLDLGSTYTYAGKKVYYAFGDARDKYDESVTPNCGLIPSYATGDDIKKFAWAMIYGNGEEKSTVMVGRFAIEIKDAGGYPGGGGDWDEPGDWDEEWEPGDPFKTLHVEVVGALSGRHNDPLNDTSYSYVPADKATVKDYGCGGDGGHGGGGGAGASSIVVYKFATDKANSKEIVCKPKRHGYGSGGGKGGKGGDGCILVYY